MIDSTLSTLTLEMIVVVPRESTIHHAPIFSALKTNIDRSTLLLQLSIYQSLSWNATVIYHFEEKLKTKYTS